MNERRIIYVDAGSTNSDNFKISLYDKTSNATHIMDLSEIENNTVAEKYAIYYAVLYIVQNDFSNTMILCDNKAAAEDNIIKALIQDLGIQTHWIPREINSIADKTCKRDSTLKEGDFNTLKLFVALSKKAYTKDKIVEEEPSTKKQTIEIKTLKESILKKNEKIKHQANQINNLQKKCAKKS